MRIAFIGYSLILIFVFSCAKKSESELLEAAMDFDEPSRRIEALTQFLDQYPETDQKNRILNTVFSDYCKLKNESRALIYADKYISQYPPEGRMRVYNSVAWILAENDLGSDSAVVYARRAVNLAERTNPRLKNMILDTYAFALYKNGQPEAARETQKKVLAENADDPDYLSRMADYQFDSGKKADGIRSLLKTLLFSSRTDGYQKLNKWLVELEPNTQKRGQLKRDMVMEQINDYLKNTDTPIRRSRAAVMLAFSDTDTEQALQWAQSALRNAQENLSIPERSSLSKNLARVYEACGEYNKMCKTLEDVKIYTPAFDTEFWLSLGHAYEKTGQRQEALKAYIYGLIWRRNDRLEEAAGALLNANKSLDEKIAAAKKSELNFKPGKFNEGEIEGNRTVLVELFTGAECNPCVAADLAFDHLAEYFPRHRVIILENHLHIPGPDPLTNKMSESRYSFYGGDFGTPTVLIDGTQKLIGGGPDIAQRVKFYEYRDEIKQFFNEPASLTIDLTANLQQDIVTLETIVNKYSEIDSGLRLYNALVERSIDYTGGNGLKKHAFVVRHLINGADGHVLKTENGVQRFHSEIDLGQIERGLQQYLDDFTKNPPSRFRGFKKWRARPVKLNRDNLLIVSWIQDPVTKKVYQAAYQDL